MATALVTGATAGLGAEFARQLAAQGQDLVIVARDADRLEQVAEQLHSAYGVAVEVLAADLADHEQVRRVAERLSDPARPVDTLVNNAGFARRTGFLADNLAEEERAVDVMLRAVLVLSHAAARAMKQRGRGRIVNVSSVAAFVAMGTYSATKSWVVVFSEALSRELAGSGVRVTVVCPGFVHTEFHERMGMDKTIIPSFLWLDASDLVEDAWKDLMRGKPVSVPSRRYKLIVGVTRFIPRALIARVSTVGLDGRRRP